MLKIFQKKTHNELEELIMRTRSSMQNNYKDNAQEYFKSFCSRFDELLEKDELNDKQKEYYSIEKSILAEELKGFTHKNQKPYWH